ncbi:unnamed protein product [marine sediment metagenome]|uniref:Uncharacterized protein n=1 Tax=marine sediment metagenome TaxID=412755 RepID=X0TKN6_9ZZZZ
MECPNCCYDDKYVNLKIADESAKREIYNYGYGLPYRIKCEACEYEFKIKVDEVITTTYTVVEE